MTSSCTVGLCGPDPQRMDFCSQVCHLFTSQYAFSFCLLRDVTYFFSSIMQHHHQHRKHQKCKSHAIHSFPWKIYSRAFSWFLWSTSGLHQSHRKQPLPLPSHTCSGWIHLQWLRALPPFPYPCYIIKKIIWDECSTDDHKFSLGLQIFLDQRLSRTIDQKLWSLFFCFFV